MQENMERAQQRDAVHREKFYFRKSVVPEDDEDEAAEEAWPHGSHDHEYTEMSVDTIINGKVWSHIVYRYHLLVGYCYCLVCGFRTSSPA